MFSSWRYIDPAHIATLRVSQQLTKLRAQQKGTLIEIADLGYADVKSLYRVHASADQPCHALSVSIL